MTVASRLTGYDRTVIARAREITQAATPTALTGEADLSVAGAAAFTRAQASIAELLNLIGRLDADDRTEARRQWRASLRAGGSGE